MLFNSFVFLLAFLPLTVLGFWALGLWRAQAAVVWLTVASLLFYSWWDATYTVLLLLSIAFNFNIGRCILSTTRAKKLVLSIGIGVDLLVLFYYKYAVFFLKSIAVLSHHSFDIPEIILPLGISFFTFTQIAYLADAYHKKIRETDGLRYALFVSYFPHLIAGPIIHHANVMPQFNKPSFTRFNKNSVLLGSVVFILGLSKKLLFADTLAGYANGLYNADLSVFSPTQFEAWGASIAYSLQLYFDFSAYSDMAIGLSLLFGVTLPINFRSPYKAKNIIDFWHRWHISLSTFLRDYLYIPLGGNRKGPTRRYINLLITMLLGGLWHGANWTFVVWGLLHGVYLLIAHGWQAMKAKYTALNQWSCHICYKYIAQLLTLMAVLHAWVFFRANSISDARRIIHTMWSFSDKRLPSQIASFLERWPSPLDGLAKTLSHFFTQHGYQFVYTPFFQGKIEAAALLIGLIIVLFLPNNYDRMQRFTHYFERQKDSSIVKGKSLVFQPTWTFGFILGVLFFICLQNIYAVPETVFLYYNF